MGNGICIERGRAVQTCRDRMRDGSQVLLLLEEEDQREASGGYCAQRDHPKPPFFSIPAEERIQKQKKLSFQWTCWIGLSALPPNNLTTLPPFFVALSSVNPMRVFTFHHIWKSCFQASLSQVKRGSLTHELYLEAT